MQTLTVSPDPIQEIDKAAYIGQNPKMRMWKPGYEHWFNEFPVLSSPRLNEKVFYTKTIMQNIANHLSGQSWIYTDAPQPGEFDRTIIGIQKGGGTEVIVARWGKGFSSPVHGHASGYMHEEIITGKMRVNTFRQKDPFSNVVVPFKTEIVERGTFVSKWSDATRSIFPRPHLIHNFTALTPAVSLHYLPEHTRDGRDNGFNVEWFDCDSHDLEQIGIPQSLRMIPGNVCLVRSSNVPDLGDHYIIVTGKPVMKPWGLRPQEHVIGAPNMTELLDKYKPVGGLTLLRLHPFAQKEFLKHHGIKLVKGEVILPTL